MKNLKIGITIDSKHIESLWVNGLHLNVLYLYKLLKKSKNNYEVCLLTKEPYTPSPHARHLKGIPIHQLSEKYEELDFIIVMGTQVEYEIIKKFKSSPNKKMVYYACGNTYLFTLEKTLFKPCYREVYQFEDNLDEIWFVPQQQENNEDFCSIMYKTNAIPVPFVWHNEFLLDAAKEVERNFKAGRLKKGFGYDKTKAKKTIGVLEPNLNIIKCCLIPTMVTEECYRTEVGKEKINELILCSAEKMSKDLTFLSILKKFGIYNDGKVKAEGRFQTSFIVTQYIDVLLSHQIFNALNYLYLDVAYLGYPVLHNAWMCKDVGYYYEGNDVQQAASKLEWILTNHDNTRNAYRDQNDKALFRFSIDNPKILEVYDTLIDNLYTKGNNGRKVYNPDTNFYVD
jgi:hypothetical protein